MGIVKTAYSSLESKLNNKGTPGIFIGYSMNHGTNVYRIFNNKTKGISVSRDIIWLNVSFGIWKSRLLGFGENDVRKDEYDVRNLQP